MNILKLNNGNTYFLPKYDETSDVLTLTISGFLVNEIKSLDSTSLKTVEITTETSDMIGTYSDMELGSSISYDTVLNQTTFTLQKNGTSDLSDQIKDLKSTVSGIQVTVDTVNSLLTTSVTASDKDGYNWKITYFGNVEITKEYIKSDESASVEKVHDGSDYTKPAYYTVGMTVTKGLWYCQESEADLVYECIKDGVPTSFTDTEYFDVV